MIRFDDIMHFCYNSTHLTKPKPEESQSKAHSSRQVVLPAATCALQRAISVGIEMSDANRIPDQVS